MGVNNYQTILRIELNDQMCYSEHHLMVPEHFYCWVAGSFKVVFENHRCNPMALRVYDFIKTLSVSLVYFSLINLTRKLLVATDGSSHVPYKCSTY